MPIVPLCNDAHGDELADSFLLPEQFIDMLIHVKKYFECHNIAQGYKLVLYIDISFHNTTKFFKNITLHIKLKNLSHRTELQNSFILKSG
jgi:hypothetical protein